jgi:hypothetical protein
VEISRNGRPRHYHMELSVRFAIGGLPFFFFFFFWVVFKTSDQKLKNSVHLYSTMGSIAFYKNLILLRYIISF